MGKGVAREAKKKDNPFMTMFSSGKESLLMMHDIVNEAVRQLPVPSQQQLMSYVSEQTRAVVSTRRPRGKRATLSVMHLCLGIVLSGLEGYGSQLKLWRRLCLEAMVACAPLH